MLQGKLLWSQQLFVSGSISALLVLPAPSHQTSQKNKILHLSLFDLICHPPYRRFLGFRSVIRCWIKCAAIAIATPIRRHRPVNSAQGHDQHPEQGRWPRIPRVCSPLCSISPSQVPPAAAAKGACSSTEDPLCTQEAAEGVCTGGCDRHSTQVCLAQQQQRRGVSWPAGGLTARLPAAVGRLQRWRCHR